MSNIKRLTEADYEDIFTLSEFAFQYKLSATELEEKKAEADRHIIWGWMDQENIAAKLHMIPLSIYINGKEFAMGGISSVATWPEYRRQGMVKHLLHHALTYMKKHGQAVSFLHPFSFGFYRKYGWEHTFSEKKYTIPLTLLKKNWEADGYVRRVQNDLVPLQKIYKAFAKQYTGPLVRDEKWWRQRILNKPNNIVVSYSGSDEAEGYLLYEVKNSKMTVKELAYRSLNGLKLLLQFIGHHDSMAEKVTLTVPANDQLALLLDEPTFDQEIIPYFMARIVDVYSFLQLFSFTQSLERPLYLHVEDNFLLCNSGIYQLTQNKGKTDVMFLGSNNKFKHQDNVVKLTIQSLTSIFLGYQRPRDLYTINHIQGSEVAVQQLEELIPHQQPFFPDFF